MCRAAIAGCLVDHPLLQGNLDALETRARELSIVPFDERSGGGDLRYVWAKTNGPGDRHAGHRREPRNQARTTLEFTLVELDTEWALLVRPNSVQADRSKQPCAAASPRLLGGVAELRRSCSGSQVHWGHCGFCSPIPRSPAARLSAVWSQTASTGREPTRAWNPAPQSRTGVRPLRRRRHHHRPAGRLRAGGCRARPTQKAPRTWRYRGQGRGRFLRRDEAVARGRAETWWSPTPARGAQPRVCSGASYALQPPSCGDDELRSRRAWRATLKASRLDVKLVSLRALRHCCRRRRTWSSARYLPLRLRSARFPHAALRVRTLLPSVPT